MRNGGRRIWSDNRQGGIGMDILNTKASVDGRLRRDINEERLSKAHNNEHWKIVFSPIPK